MNPLAQIILQELPNVLDFATQEFIKRNPDAPVPTSEEVSAAYQEALRSSIDKDEKWKASHPTDA